MGFNAVCLQAQFLLSFFSSCTGLPVCEPRVHMHNCSCSMLQRCCGTQVCTGAVILCSTELSSASSASIDKQLLCLGCRLLLSLAGFWCQEPLHQFAPTVEAGCRLMVPACRCSSKRKEDRKKPVPKGWNWGCRGTDQQPLKSGGSFTEVSPLGGR